ncbi:MAG: 3-hydroxyacyl-ACP dehydratase FabZ, partial [Rhodospirillales bacterium]|nr:3-hydroxyacyl-ACP dehydratase FabZ [Rhodospirillales bacterium]
MDGATPQQAAVPAAQNPQNSGETIDVVDILRVMQAIPHRYPFLLIDRVVEVVRNVSAIGIKNVSVNESFFAGHFPNHPVMPGVLIIESMAQTAAVLVVEPEMPACETMTQPRPRRTLCPICTRLSRREPAPITVS